MSPEEKIEMGRKLIAEAEAEIAAKKRKWPEKIEAGMVFSVFDQLFMPFSHANDGICRWKICLNDGAITELGPIEYGSTAFGYKGRASDGLRWSDPTEACANAAGAHEPTGAELVGKMCQFSDDGESWDYGPYICGEYREDKGYSWGACNAFTKYARLAR